MSAYMLFDKGEIACANCGAGWQRLDPKIALDDELYVCECLDCRYRDKYLYPKGCLECGYEDWDHYKNGDYPDRCPDCKSEEW